MLIKLMFYKKATKIDKIFTVNLTVTTYCQIDGEDFVNFCGFSENVNFKTFKGISDDMNLPWYVAGFY